MPLRLRLVLLVLLPLAPLLAQEVGGDAEVRRLLARFQASPGTASQPARLLFDGRPVLAVPGRSLTCAVEWNDKQPQLVVRNDGTEAARAALRNLVPTIQDLPPLAVPDLDAVTVKSESRSVNGVSTTRVWLDGRLVYEGPGSRSQSSTRSSNGRRSATVTVDGRVVYHIGEGQGAVTSAKAP